MSSLSPLSHVYMFLTQFGGFKGPSLAPESIQILVRQEL